MAPTGYGYNLGIERGIRIGSVKDGKVKYFIPDPCPYHYVPPNALHSLKNNDTIPVHLIRIEGKKHIPQLLAYPQNGTDRRAGSFGYQHRWKRPGQVGSQEGLSHRGAGEP